MYPWVSVLTFISRITYSRIIYLIDHISILNNTISISRIMKYELMTDNVCAGGVDGLRSGGHVRHTCSIHPLKFVSFCFWFGIPSALHHLSLVTDSNELLSVHQIIINGKPKTLALVEMAFSFKFLPLLQSKY